MSGRVFGPIRNTLLPLMLGATLGVLSSGGWSCGGNKTYETLHIVVASEAGVSVDRITFRILKLDDGARYVVPRDPDDFSTFMFDVIGMDLSDTSFSVRLRPGEMFQGVVTVVVLGISGPNVTARAVVDADLSYRGEIKAVLEAVDSGCDMDVDGFPDCSREGCCAADEPFGDCNDDEAGATPVGFEDECTRCGYGEALSGDRIDDDCNGEPARCRDDDGDQARDCMPTWCLEESKGSPSCLLAEQAMDCDPADATVFPEAVELCDYKDNDCNGVVDDNAPTTIVDWDGEVRELGEECGTGICKNGIVECNPETGKAWCKSENEPEPAEICGNGEDDDCNGLTDSEDGCDENDMDGDGVDDLLEDKYCGPLAKFHSEIFPEYEADEHPDVPGSVLHVGPEPCCCNHEALPGDECPELCDLDCDGYCTFCDESDQDCDGYSQGPDNDCNDEDPTVHANAPEKCGDGIDQDCKGGDADCKGFDSDGDKYFADLGDCDDSDPETHPYAMEECNGVDDDCNGYVDDGNPGGNDEPCGSDVGECAFGVLACVFDTEKPAAEQVECVGDKGPEPEVCDGLDNDCNDSDDDVFHYDEETGATCDEGGGGPCNQDWPITGEQCTGHGECGNVPGVVECDGEQAVGCSTNPAGSEHQDKAELCDNKDNDCDNLTDEDLTNVEMSTCLDIGVCGGEGHQYIAAECVAGDWQCGYMGVPGYEPDETTCDDKDNDCDGETDEGFMYSDDVHPDPVPKGAGCGTGECANGIVVCSEDGSGLICDTTMQQDSELCDGLDNDCDGMTDEDFEYQGVSMWKDPEDIGLGANECTGIGECGNVSGVIECKPAVLDEADCSTNPKGTNDQSGEETCDNKDNDCDGVTDEGLDDVGDSTCLKQGVCDPSEVIVACAQGQWICDYGSIPDYETPIETTCDGKDNDCDGLTDEATAQDCDDGIPCTLDECQGGQCTNTLKAGNCLINGTCYSNGASNLANECEYCDPSQTDIAWTDRSDGTTCDFDGDGCTQGDECKGGECEKGDTVDCSGLDGPCAEGQCNSLGSNSFQCEVKPIKEGVSCDDGSSCTEDDKCVLGECEGTLYDCDDGSSCTADMCDGLGGCDFPMIAGWCLIGGDCIEEDTENPVNDCHVCDPASNDADWTNRPDTTACDDSDECTTEDACSGGTCQSTGVLDCDDDEECTDDDCDPASGCTYEDNALLCDEAECKGGSFYPDVYCSGGTCPAQVPVSCDDGKDCSIDQCNLTVGCFHVDDCDEPNPTCTQDGCRCGATECDENTADNCSLGVCRCGAGSACTAGDSCCTGICKSGGCG